MGCPSDTMGDADLNDCTGYELENDLDFDTDGDGATHTGGTSDSGDAYHNAGSGWDPIGPNSAPSDSTHFNAIFDGKGQVIENLYVNRSRSYSGLFAALQGDAVVRSLGLRNAHVLNGATYVGLLGGRSAGRVAAVWTSGRAHGSNVVGGLAGLVATGGTIVASYSTAAVECTAAGAQRAGGLASANNGSVVASYSTGTVTGPCQNKSGLAGPRTSGTEGTFAASYWDTTRSGINDDSDANPPEGVTSTNLRTPTGYSGIYSTWDDQDVDDDNLVGRTADSDDDAWDFGDQWQWPVLKFGGHDVARQVAEQPNLPPTFTGTVAQSFTYRRNFQIDPFQIPAATGGEGAGGYTYTASSLPPGIVFDADGTGSCPGAAPRMVCGTPTTSGTTRVTIYAADGDTNTDDDDRAELEFVVAVVDATAALASNPAALTEATLNGAEVTVTLTSAVFESGVTSASFMLDTNVTGLTIGSLATVTAGDASATLTLAYDDTDFDTARTLAVTVAEAAHDLKGALTTAMVTVTPSLEATVSPADLTLSEGATATFTAVLDSLPAATTTVAVASSDVGAATVDTATLTFTTTDWNTAQTVTVTALADDDADGESVSVTLTVAGVGTLATVPVTVVDDDRGTLLIDADPSTPEPDPGPLLLAEGESAGYSVRLSARPTANATVSVTSADPGAVWMNRSSLVFTPTNWNTPQTVTATATADSDAVDESVSVAHAATGGGYGGTASSLRVGVADAERTNTDYDADEDGLIEVATLSQLDAIRWDLDGDGAAASNDGGAYATAFPTASAGMGCPTGGCKGYELTQDLDFDTDGDGSTHANGASDADDAWHNGGNGWDPIGPSVVTTYQERLRRIREESFNAVFDGNGYSIHNLFINRGRDWAALFSGVRADGVLRSLGLPNAYVDGGASGSVAPLAGTIWGRVEAAWATGAVAGGTNVAGLVGSTNAGSTIVASYSTASADCGTGAAAGLVGHNVGAIVASYATGAVTGSGCQTQNKHGLAAGTGTATASHWDSEASGVTVSAQGRGRTTAQLQGPTSATGIFAGWDKLDVDGDGDPNESPWHFGRNTDYPTLSYRGADAALQRGDYDADDDGLIEIRTLAQLNAVRWDLDGDGAPASGNASAYGLAFRDHAADMGCPTDNTDADDNDCKGYELENDLDFDTDGDGSTWTGNDMNGAPIGDSGDAYHNGGSGWDPIGAHDSVSAALLFNAVFDGNGHVVANLLVNRALNDLGLFSRLFTGATVRSLGLTNARISGATNVGALVGQNNGRFAAVWSTGAVAGNNQIGGLAGRNWGTIAASYSTASVFCSTAGNNHGGGLTAGNWGTVATSYATGAVTGSCQSHGLTQNGGTTTASYWDTDRSGINDDADGNPPEGVTSANLKSPTGYTGIYAVWDDQDVDDDGTTGRALDADDDAWDFGNQHQWPVLKFGGHDVARQVALQPSTAPAFGGGSVPDKVFQTNVPIQAFQIPAASGGDGTVSYSAINLPQGLSLGAPNCAARTVCGTPTLRTPGAATVTVHADDADTNRTAADRATLTFAITIFDPRAALATAPATLTEGNLDGAVAQVTLADTTFASGVTQSSFVLNTTVPGLTIASLAAVTPDRTTALLALAHDGTDFDAAATVSVTVPATAHAHLGALTTPEAAVSAATVDATVTPGSLALNEDGGATSANEGSFTVVLQSAPAANVTLAVASSDTGAATVSGATVGFSPTNWNTAKTVTVTAQQDHDANDETVAVTLTAAGVGVVATVTVDVDDDDAGTVLIDADPSTPALDPGPLHLTEATGAGNARGYAVRLSAAPTGSVTVAVTSGRTLAVTVDQSSLTFTAQNWATAQTVTATAVDDTGSRDESVTITHAATGGGYGGASASLRVAVADDERDATKTDYDTDEDGLIEISTIAQLNAVRWDADGAADPISSEVSNYNAAFPNFLPGLGCPRGGCRGYELTRDLDFDTDGDGSTWSEPLGVFTADSGDSAYNSGNGWLPIGRDLTGHGTTDANRIANGSFNAVFDGNGHVIYNLLVNRNRNWSGLFAALRSGAVVRSLGVANVRVRGTGASVGALAGQSWGRVEGVWATGAVQGGANIGGLLGRNLSGGVVVASYSKTAVDCTGMGSARAGGLAAVNAGTVTASYATGELTGSCPNKHGLAALAVGTATASYWDVEASGIDESAQGGGRTTARLQAPTSALGDYAGWDALDVDGDGDPHESPWDFGTSSQYPALRYRGADDPLVQRGDYDLDGDGLIEIRTLTQLNAVRWDLNGDGAPSSNAGPYGRAFRHHRPDMGCPVTDADANANDCAGYELANDLDFDTDGDGATHSNGASDSGDAYHNGGSGWEPIGANASPSATTHFAATFDGNGRVIDNLFVNRNRSYLGLFSGLPGGATIRALGLPDAQVRGGALTVFAGPLAGYSSGRAAAVWASGLARGINGVGGLVGQNAGTVTSSYATAAVECTGTTSSSVGGGLAGLNTGTIVASYATGTVTGACPRKHGLTRNTLGTTTASYWDSDISGISGGQTSTNLRTPTGYTGLYADWDDQDVDDDGTTGVAADPDDDAWDFGGQWQWPVLKFGGHDTARQIALQPNTAPTFSGTVPNKTFRRNFDIPAFQVPAATGGEGGSYTYFATAQPLSMLPPGLTFDGDGTGSCGQARTFCGRPTQVGTWTVAVGADDGDTNRAQTDRAALLFTLKVVEPVATIGQPGGALAEATLDGAKISVNLTDTTFESGVTTASFTLNTDVPGLTIGSLATVTAGDTSATLTLAYNDTDFDTTGFVGVTVKAAAHALAGPITSSTADVRPSLEATVSPSGLTLTEASTGGSNTGTFTAVLDSLPAATTTVAVTSGDAGAATVDNATLTFTTSNWATAQTVTVTAQADDDANDESTTITLSAASVGVLATVSVDVTDDDRGRVLIDADPTTPALDPGPLLLAEGDTGDYTVRLSAAPSGGSATVAVTSGDTSAVTVNSSSLTFTATNWNTPQTVTATAVAEASDSVDESVAITHTATGGGYGGTSSSLRVGVSDAQRTGTDYDTDEDGLIEISTLAQLNAVRWDLDGNGAVTSGNQANYSGASGAFASASAGMGCPAVSNAATCTGYELMRDLDFDTDGDGSTHVSGTSDSGDTYHNSGSGWDPIGPASTPSDSTHFNATFDGNGHSIDNLYINRSRNYAGLFAALRGSATVRSLGLPNAHVRAGQGSVAPLAGASWGRVEAVWASGSAAGNTNVGGLVGAAQAGSTIVASYSKAAAQCGAGSAGGLAGDNAGTIVASYAIGAITGSCAASNKHGLAGGGGTATASHWDTAASSVAASAQGTGRTTSQLQTPTSATGIYAGWDALDVDGDGNPHEAPWDFGKNTEYPALSYRGMDPVPQTGDYDQDDNGLIEVRTLAQLNAIRWDLDGDGTPSTGTNDAASYGKAFRGHATGMGCKSTGCIGYELENDLDFDTDGDGSTHTGGTSDSGDAYHNAGSGWDPLGPATAPSDTTHFDATFDGKGHSIRNLFINRSRNYVGLFAALRGDAVVRALGLPNARVRSGSTNIGLLAGDNAGRIAAVWSSGAVEGTTAVGGLAGYHNSGATIVASYSTATVACTGSGSLNVGGGLAGYSEGTIAASYATGTVTGACPRKHGLARIASGTVTASYWDTNRSGIDDDSDANPPEGITSANLRAPTGYTGIYALWDDQDVDGDNLVGRAADADDDAWDFGGQFQWPVLKFGGLSVARQIALQPNVPPTFGSATVPNKSYRKDVAIAPFLVPPASGGEGTGYTYSASGLPAGLSFGTPDCASARQVCGTPTADTAGAATVTIYAHDGDTNRGNSDRAELAFTITVVTPTAALTSVPAALTEATLNGAELTVTLTGATFESGVTASSFILNTNVVGLTVGSLATVTAGDTSATLTLAYNDTDFDTARTLGVTVVAAAHALPGTIVSPLVPVTPSLEATVSPPSLALNENSSSSINARTFTARLDSLPAANTTVAVASSDTGAARVSAASLTFTTTNWNTAQTVTVTAQADDDANNETVAVTLSAAGVGVLATVSVTVADDDRGTVVIDADPNTPARESGPLLLAEGASGSYSVRLSARPTATATVAVASDDTGAVTVNSSSLTFTTTNWNTPQTVTAMAVAEASDAVDESVTITHTATGGGYGGTSSSLRVGVSDAQRTGTDFDTDEDGLIDISTLAQLNAVRWDLDGDGAVSADNAANYSGASGAFASASTGMGCPTGGCTGYELTRDLDFDTDGDGSTHTSGTGDSGDTYYNSGSGWDPIGPASTTSDSTHFNATFDGNGHSIHNLFVNRSRDLTGLFAALRPNAVVRSLGLPNVRVRNGATWAGALAGESRGRVAAVWATGAVQGQTVVGGLLGVTTSGATLTASYSVVAVDCTATSGVRLAGGLVGGNNGAVAASYSTGAVTGSCTDKNGLAGGSGTATASHWDRQASSVTTSAQGAGRTTAQLKTPTSATGIFAGWDALDVDGDGDPHEAPWHFGKNTEYPALSYRGADVVPQRGDYDQDDDGLIEIRTLAQLNAVRWDLDGDGTPSTGTNDAASYGKAFRGHATGMGCKSTGCTGYELENDLDFDTDGDGSTHTGGTSDSGDAYHNAGSGWDPLGPASAPTATTHFNATFDGKGHSIRNLFVNRSRNYVGLFAALNDGATVHSLGLPNVRILAGNNRVGGLAGENEGRVAAAWSSGAVAANNQVGGLVGNNDGGSTIVASYSTAAVECAGTGASSVGGGLAGFSQGAVVTSYSTGTVTGNCPRKHGLVRSGSTGTVAASYWDTNRSGIDDDSDANPPEGVTSANLRAPTGYTGIYALWDDQDVDGDNLVGRAADADDDAWDFGGQFQWPVLKFGGHDTARQIALQPNVPPTFGSGAVANRTYRKDHAIAPFLVPPASGGEGTGYTYSASGLPAGLSFGTPNCASARQVCGTPTANTTGAATVMIHAHDGDTNRANSDRAELTFTITVTTPEATISSSPLALTEATLNGAELTVTLTGTTFESGVTAASFRLNTDVTGLVIDSLATVTAGDTSATLTLAYDDTDFDAPRFVGVTVPAAAHALPGDITSATASVTPSLEATVSRSSLTLTEASGGSNTGTFTAVLDSLPAATTTVAVASADAGAAAVDNATLTFTTTNWATAQTVTVTAQADDDADNEETTITLSASAVGVLATVTVTVTDDDRGRVLIDANPATPALDPGPLLLAEGDTGDYTVRLSAAPSGGSATVAVASGDTGAVTVNSSSLTFTATNWNTPQTVTATAVVEASDSVDESVTITHEATGGGYNGASASLRVGVSDAERTGTDYDTDEDGLIEISTLAQLNAVRWDLDGNGAVTSGNAANYSGASGAFASASTGMGCPTGGCSGYELTRDLDFDTDGDGSTHTSGTSDSDDTYHNGGSGWDPIGPASTPSDSTHFNATFDGNGHSIHNLFINRNRDYNGLFAALRGSATVRSLGLPNAHVQGGQGSKFGAAPLAAVMNGGRVEASWASGSVAGVTNVGGLVGGAIGSAVVVASYSTAAVACASGSGNLAGGLMSVNGGTIVASYATGTVTGCATANMHGLASHVSGGTAISSYWDREASGITVSAQGRGRATAQLQAPTSATGIYAGWDALDVDGDGDPHEAPWHFGTSSQYPALSYRGADTVPQRGDYDLDDNGLIEVRTLAQLNAIRWDLNGDGTPSTGTDDAANYGKAFRGHAAGMGCPAVGGCTGYELENDLDFDTDGDGSTWTDDFRFIIDRGDAYANGVNGWDPIGPNSAPTTTTHFNATFDGKGRTIANMVVNRSRDYQGLFGGLAANAVVRSLGLPNVRVYRAFGFAGALAGRNAGRIAGAWSSGVVEARDTGGGLVGQNDSGATIVASYSIAEVEGWQSTSGRVVGGLAAVNEGTIAASYAAGAVTGIAPVKHGLAGGSGTFTASYWDTDLSGIDDDAGTASPEGVSSENLRQPTGYTGIYAAWDEQDVDGDNVVGSAADADDDAWDFGGQFQWPALKFGGLDTARQIAEHPNVPPTFGSGAVANKTYRKDHAIAPFLVPPASSGDGTPYTYSASGLPAGLSLGAPNCASARQVCGTPTANTAGAATVTIYAHDGDTNLANSDRAELNFTITVVTPTAALAASSPTTLTEANLDGATVTVTLTDTAFASGVTKSRFTPSTNVPGLTIDSLATVTAGDATATLTLDYAGTDFSAVRTLSVTVAAAAHDLPGTLATGSLSITPTPGIALSRATLPLEEDPAAGGGTNANVGTYTVRLTANPTTAAGGNCTVVVTATSGNADVSLDTDATPLTKALTFTQANWNSPQTVTVTVASDNDSQNDAATISHARTGTACSGGFFGTPTLPSLTVNVTDDEAAGIVLDADPNTPGDQSGPLALAELSTASNNSVGYTVRLSAEPTQDVTVTIASNDTTAVTVDDTDGDSVNGVQDTLTFTSANWSTAQTVTLTAADDNDGTAESATITHTATTATTSEYSNVQATITANTTDDDAPAFVFDADPSSPATDEAGPLALEELSTSSTNSADYSVRLSSQPTQTVTATISSGNTASVTVGDTDTGTPGDQNTLTFTASNWDTPQTVTLTAQDDDNGYDERVTITHSAATPTSSEYTNVSDDFTASVTDDETPAITLSGTSLSVPEEDSATYTVRLATEPVGGSVTVTITGAADGLAANPTSLTFTAANWDTTQTVTVTAANDQDGGNETATFSHAASGADYGSVAAAELVATSTDDDTPSLRVSTASLTVDENSSATYTMRLNTQPSASVTVTVTGASGAVTVDTAPASGNQNTLTFTRTNWNTNQTVTVAAGDDGNAVNEMLTLAHGASGGDYGSLALASRPGVQVTVDDDDTAGIVLDANPATTNIDEAGPLALAELSTATNNSVSYTVRLSSEPTQDATVTITSGDTSAVTVDDTDGDSVNGVQNTLTFTAANWSTAQTVTLTAVQDSDGVGENVTITHTAATATASEYTNLQATIRADTTDKDAPAFVFDADPDAANDQAGPLALDEDQLSAANSDDYTVRLSSQPTQTVTATITSGNASSVTVGDTDTDTLGDQNTLTFTSSNWDTPQTVTLTAQQDDNGYDERVTIAHAAATTTNSEYRNVRGSFTAST